ncbi:MAG TPA: hypothetical protein VKG82_03700 [Solirubrobacteraceae bacterium]|nr:hypothetical protein [Solirubrobacteraceae bacterium]HME04895.1 hypothetical protein [Solirubrobacteraceae bacterium]
MARIRVQSDNRRIAHEVHNARNTEVTAHEQPGRLLDRRERTIQNADHDQSRQPRLPERLLVIVPARSYLDLSG